MLNVFLIVTATQYINAIEAYHKFDLNRENSVLILITTAKVIKNQLNNIIDYSALSYS